MTPEETLKQAEAKAKTSQDQSATPPRGGKKPAKKDLERSLAMVSDAQYQRGVEVVRRVGEGSFFRGIEDSVDQMISSVNDAELISISARFQKEASKRLKPNQPLMLPVSAWLSDEEVIEEVIEEAV